MSWNENPYRYIKKQNDKGLKWRHHKKFNKIKEGDEPITS